MGEPKRKGILRRIQPDFDSGVGIAGLAASLIFGLAGGAVVGSQVIEMTSTTTTTETVTAPPITSTTTETVTRASGSATAASCAPGVDQSPFREEATTLGIGARCVAAITAVNDVDFFAIEAPGKQVLVSISKDPRPREDDGVYVTVFDGAEDLEHEDIYGYDGPLEIRRVIEEELLVEVRDPCDTGGTTCASGNYVVSVEPIR
jgi:hypothetical protein